MLARRQFGFGLFAAASSPFPEFEQDRAPPPAFATEFITFSSRGRLIRAAAFRPLGAARNAGVVYIHGSGGIGPNQIAFAQEFAAAGYVTLVPTYLDAAADDGVRRTRIMSAWRECGSDAVEWLIGQGVEPERTAIVGYSLGSHIAVDGALGESRAAAAIGVAGGWDVYPPRLPSLRIPVLIVRAERDTHVRPESTERLRRYLLERDVAVQMGVIRGAGHLLRPREWLEVSAMARGFLGTRTGAPTDHDRSVRRIALES